jgi:hypothetical protein
MARLLPQSLAINESKTCDPHFLFRRRSIFCVGWHLLFALGALFKQPCLHCMQLQLLALGRECTLSATTSRAVTQLVHLLGRRRNGGLWPEISVKSGF